MDIKIEQFATAQLEMIALTTQISDLQRQIFALPMNNRSRRLELEELYQALREELYQALREEEERLIEMVTDIQVRRLETILIKDEAA